MKILIDSDLEVVYRAGFASEPMMYYINGKTFHLKKDAVEYCKNSEIDPAEIKGEKQYFSQEYALQIAEEYIERIVNAAEEEYGPYLLLEHYLTGKENFRKEADPTYKCSRKKKPKHYKIIRELLFDKYNANQVEWYEADDLIGIRARYLRDKGYEYLVVSKDKDLDQIPGFHYNTNRREFYEVTEEEGERFLWQQMLVGDRADDVSALYGVGDKTALKMMEDISTVNLPDFVEMHYEFNDIQHKFSSNLECLTILQEI